MKILLIMPHPNSKRDFLSKISYPCLTLQQIAGITPLKHHVRIIDERYEGIDFNKDYDLVGISCLTYNSYRGYEISKVFRKKGVPVVFGGYHASLIPQEVKKHADAVVIGEAELSWPRLLKDLENGKLKPFYNAKRLAKPEEIPPARHDIGSYIFHEAIQASRGCPTGCEFCSMNQIEGKKFRGRPVDNVIDEMKKIKSKNIFFADASLTINPKYSKELFTAMKELNKKVRCFGNINVLTSDDEFLKLSREAGIKMWYVGLESISQENINQAGKGTNKVKNYGKAIRKIKDHGIKVTGYFMFGFDKDTPEIFNKTLQAIYNWELDSASFSILTPYPNTRLFERLEKEGRIKNYDWSKYNEGNVNYKPKKLTEEELLEGIRFMKNDYFSVKQSLIRSFRSVNQYNKNPINIIISFVENISLKYFYKYNKID